MHETIICIGTLQIGHCAYNLCAHARDVCATPELYAQRPHHLRNARIVCAMPELYMQHPVYTRCPKIATSELCATPKMHTQHPHFSVLCAQSLSYVRNTRIVCATPKLYTRRQKSTRNARVACAALGFYAQSPRRAQRHNSMHAMPELCEQRPHFMSSEQVHSAMKKMSPLLYHIINRWHSYSYR